MPAPINYMGLMPNPLESAVQGLKLGADIENIQFKRLENQMLLAQKQRELQEKQRQQELMTSFIAKPNKTFEDYQSTMLQLPGMREHFNDAWKMHSENEQKSSLGELSGVFSALDNNKPEIALQTLETRIEALKNSNAPPDRIQAATAMRDSIKLNPDVAKTSIGMMLASIPGGDKVLQGATTVSGEARAKAKELRDIALHTPALKTAAAQAVQEEAKAGVAETLAKLSVSKADWDIRNLKDQITDRSLTRGLRAQEVAANVADKLSSISARAVDIPEAAQKLINEAAVNAGVLKVSASQFNDLAKRLEAEGGGWGAASSLSDWASRFSGFEGGTTGLRQEYIRLRNTSAIKSLPPGPATDKDIQMALQGFPSATADAKVVASFLRGMAKLQDIDAAIAGAKVDWMSQNKGLMTRAKSDFVAGDYAAKPGEAWVDFSQRVAKDIAAKYGKAATAKDIEREKLISQIPTPQNPTPGVNPIRQQADAIISGGK